MKNVLRNTSTIFFYVDSKQAFRRNEKTRIETIRMTPRIFNVKNYFNVKNKNHEIKPVNIFTIKSSIIMTLSIEKNISYVGQVTAIT